MDTTERRRQFIINVAYYAVIVGLVYLAFRYVLGWVMPFIVAFVIVSIVHPMIRWIKRKLRVERPVVSLLILVLIYLVFFGLLVFLVTQLVFVLRDLFLQLPDYYEDTIRPTVLSVGSALSRFVEELPPVLRIQLDDFQGNLLQTLQTLLLDYSQKGVSALSSWSARVPTFLIAFIFTMMLSFFISMQYDKVKGVMRRMLPARMDKVLHDLRGIIRDTVGRYLRATFTLMVITAVELSVGLLLLGVSRAPLIALGIALFDALPVFGTGAIMIPWVLIELLQGNVTLAAGMAILYGIVTLVRNIIEPKIVSDKLGLNPIVSLVSIYLGFRTLGVLGMILMPIAVQILFALYQAGNFPLFGRVMGEGEPPAGA